MYKSFLVSGNLLWLEELVWFLECNMSTSGASKSLRVMSAYEKQAENWLSAGTLKDNPFLW